MYYASIFLHQYKLGVLCINIPASVKRYVYYASIYLHQYKLGVLCLHQRINWIIPASANQLYQTDRTKRSQYRTAYSIGFCYKKPNSGNCIKNKQNKNPAQYAFLHSWLTQKNCIKFNISYFQQPSNKSNYQ